MYTISLDEFGNFEFDDQKPMMIAGLMFDDAGSACDLAAERERIRAYYRNVIRDAGPDLVYPQDLHTNGNPGRDHTKIRPVKKQVDATLAEFFSAGTYAGSPLCDEEGERIRARRGCYHLFAMLKSDKGKTNLLAGDAGMLAHDDRAANRYFHMAESVVNRLLFHNPLLDYREAPSFALDVATRSSEDIDTMDDELNDEFRSQAFEPKDGRKSQYYRITNADVYRSMIAQEMTRCGKTSLQIETICVRPIRYRPEAEQMEFLYLSDSICSLLGYGLIGAGAEDWLVQIADRLGRVNPGAENLLFGYDDIDQTFSQAWECFEHNRLTKAFTLVFEAGRKTGAFAEHYRNVLFPYLEKRIRENITPELFDRCVNDLSGVPASNNMDPEKLLYLVRQLEEMTDLVADRYESPDVRARTMIKLIDVEMAAYCHTGNTAKARERYESLRAYAPYMGMDARARSSGRLVICLEDSFAWEEALRIARQNVALQQTVAASMGPLPAEAGDGIGNLVEAKTISQLARVLALRKDEEAEVRFREALSKLRKESANYKVTQSYLLHYYADMGRKDAFDAESLDYFEGRRTYKQRLRYLTALPEHAQSLFSKEYALYVLIRGLCRFHPDEIDEALWSRLLALDAAWVEKGARVPGGHPWELIYKYLELEAIRRKDTVSRAFFKERRQDCLHEKGESLVALERFADAEAADCEGDTALRDSLTAELSGYMKEHFPALADAVFPADGAERFRVLREKYFTFMNG